MLLQDDLSHCGNGIPGADRSPQALLIVERELNDLGGFALGGFESPLGNRFKRCVDQNRIATKDAGTLNATVGPDDGFDADYAMEVHLLRQFGINGGNPTGNLAIRSGSARTTLGENVAAQYENGQRQNADAPPHRSVSLG